MRIVVTGATGNVGISVVEALAGEAKVDSILGLSRRKPQDLALPKVDWASADVTSSDLVAHFTSADAVVHLAWLIQPSHRPKTMAATNVTGSARVFAAVARAHVPNLIYASSVGAYSAGPKDHPVDESWPTEGIRSSFYARHKAAVERQLDRLEAEHSGIRVVRLRKGLVFQRRAAARIRRLFLGPLVPGVVLRPSLLPVVPNIPGLVFQAVHASDAAQAYRLAVLGDARGAFNIVADPVLDPAVLGRALSARPVPLPGAVLRRLAATTWGLRLQPTPPGWLDLALSVPVLDADRARRELGWEPHMSATDALLDLLAGLRQGTGYPTPALQPGPRKARNSLG
jgi:nucleoside-diphosphate-sugar epimerase